MSEDAAIILLILYIVYTLLAGWVLMTIAGYLFHVDFSWGIAIMMGSLFFVVRSWCCD